VITRHDFPLSSERQTFVFFAHGEQAMTVKEPEFIDNPHAPDVFADGATGFFIFGGNLRITFESLRCNHITSPGPVNRVVIGRLVMPAGMAENMARGILHFLETQRSNPDAPPQAKPTLQ
jgi:hypothetical protein